MKHLLLSFLIFPFISFSQNLQLGVGAATSSIDWQYVYFDGSREPFYTDPVTTFSLSLGFEYLEKDRFSLTSKVGVHQFGGKIAPDETHDNWIIDEDYCLANVFTFGTDFNYIPVNNKLQFMLSAGPRLDYLNGVTGGLAHNNDDLNKFNVGVSLGLSAFYNLERVKFGIRSQYYHRFGMLVDRAPESGNWWENPQLGAQASTKMQLVNEFVFAFKF